MGTDAWLALLDEIRAKRRELTDGPDIWYRGHANADWELRPALLRAAEGRAQELHLYNEFVRHAPRLLPEPRKTDWENLLEMQHYGMPTRLLDWTEAFGIALFFAISEEHPRSTIFLLEPHQLNRLSGQEKIFETADVAADDLHQTIFSDTEPSHRPLAVKAPFQNPRMFAQRSVFTVFRNDDRPLDQSCPDAVRRVDFGPEVHEGAREFLEMANISAVTVFPDISGFAQFVRKVFRIQ